MKKTAAFALMLLFVSGCAPPTPSASAIASLVASAMPPATATSLPTLIPTATQAGSGLGIFDKAYENFPADINPLTGMRVADPVILDRRPVSVKVSNFPRSNRPQWGLSLADIVYEYYHNNDLTRFHAIFYGNNAPLVGPIRSGRLFDSYLMDTYESLLVFASADQRVLDRFAREQLPWQMVANLNGDCPANPVCRYEPDTLNYLVTDTSTIGNYAVLRGGENDHPDLHGMAFGQDVPAAGQLLQRIYLYYSYSAYSYWDYDAASGRYLRNEDIQEDLGGRGEAYAPLTDRLTGQQIGAENIVVLFVPHFHSFYSPATDTVPATEVVDMDFSGQGTAYAFRDGQVYEVEWVNEEGQLLYLLDANGERYPFKPGTTWFEVVNDDSKLIQSDDGWHFEFIFRRP